MKSLFFIAFIALLLSCGIPSNAAAKCDVCEWKEWFVAPQKKIIRRAAPVPYINDEDYIGLQNLETRDVVRCYSNNQYSAEQCARYFERYNFVRFRDIPYKTANYDFLKVDTYPTRRWRDSEVTPRW